MLERDSSDGESKRETKWEGGSFELLDKVQVSSHILWGFLSLKVRYFVANCVSVCMPFSRVDQGWEVGIHSYW